MVSRRVGRAFSDLACGTGVPRPKELLTGGARVQVRLRSAPPASSMTVAAGQRAQVKVPSERKREVTLDPGDLCGHSGQRPRVRREPARTGRGPSPAPCGRSRRDDEDQGAAVPGVERNGSPADSHGNEGLPDCLDVSGRPTGTRPRSRTVLNGTGRPHGNLRIRSLSTGFPG